MALPYPWQEPHARVLPQGELEWAPLAFEFRPGRSVRYIDNAGGDDARDGTTRETAWKHHPWDPAATGRAKAAAEESHTYVFKRGVAYRGVLRPSEGVRGTPEAPIQLTMDPAWGVGEAAFYASEVVSGWRRGVTPEHGPRAARIPEGEKVYVAEVPFLTRTLWSVTGEPASGGETITRLKLARTPNWTEPDPNDVMSEWPVWENPEWWKGEGHEIQVGDQKLHAGIDRKNLTGKAEDYVGATVWSEWGIVMGSPYPARVEAFDENIRAVAFRGLWTWQKLEKIIRNNRYYLEDMPHFLDEPGEFWVDRLGNNRARIFLRLPEDADPATFRIEAGRHVNVLDAKRLENVTISGLTFRFTNVHWDYNSPAWAHPDLRAAVFRLNGSGDNIVLSNNLLEHVNMLCRIDVGEGESDRIGHVSITDNLIRHTEHGAVYVRARFNNNTNRHGVLEHVDLLRNKMEHIGWRILSGEHGHAVDLTFPTSSHVAGNFLYRIGGWGLSVTGGKPSGGNSAFEIPFSRHLVHHNRVEDSLVKSNDWGAIETWQGGPFFVFNNVVHNPLGFKNWTLQPGNATSIGSFGHAYYLDGAFKNYLFNNIGAGRNNTLGTKSVNSTALQNIFSFENVFFHNTFHKFAAMTRQQEPSAGRFRYLGNVLEDVTSILFRHADPKEGEPDPNASHYTQGGRFNYATLAYLNNVMYAIRGDFGVFEETGFTYKMMAPFVEALRRLRVEVAEVGVLAERSSLANPAERDFRPAANAASAGRGVQVFVPWGLSGVVGEWRFVRNNADPSQITDEHWYMTPMYRGRERYRTTPRYPLLVRGTENPGAHFVQSGLDSWSPAAAIELDGRAMYLTVKHDTLTVDPGQRTVDIGTGNLLIEAVAVFRGRDGVLVEKRAGDVGYTLELVGGRLRFSAGDGAERLVVTGPEVVGDAPRHVLVELDRTGTDRGVRMYVDGEAVAAEAVGRVPVGSLSNTSDFVVGGRADGGHLAATLDFMRVARGTLAEARTTIGELYAWQFDGPQYRDFAGNSRRANRNDAGALIGVP